MMRRSATISILIAMVAVAAAAFVPRDASACAIAFDPSRSAPRVKGEEALIVWDESTGTEHFVRSARFEDATSSFAFLVPTPGRPELADADDRVFSRLARLYTRPTPPSTLRGRAPRGLSASATGGVTVVTETRVAGMDAAVLSATDATALAAWLRDHGYAARGDLDAWLAPYVAQRFHITAFRYDPATRTTLTSRAVRLSFATDRPYYPYAEPRDAAPSRGRTLRLSLVAPWRAEGREGARRWRARTGYADRVADAQTLLSGVIPSGVERSLATSWITTFEDSPSRRGTQDLFFQTATSQRPVAPSIVGTIAQSPGAQSPTASTR